ncbi:hypothetical protein I030019A5_13970 [Bifidobacterium bifidum]
MGLRRVDEQGDEREQAADREDRHDEYDTNANGHMNFQPRQSRLCLFTRAKGDTLTDVMPLSFEGLEAKHTAQNLPQRNSSLNLFREMHPL